MNIYKKKFDYKGQEKKANLIKDIEEEIEKRIPNRDEKSNSSQPKIKRAGQ